MFRRIAVMFIAGLALAGVSTGVAMADRELTPEEKQQRAECLLEVMRHDVSPFCALFLKETA